jgi:hypothetical protein
MTPEQGHRAQSLQDAFGYLVVAGDTKYEIGHVLSGMLTKSGREILECTTVIVGEASHADWVAQHHYLGNAVSDRCFAYYYKVRAE